MKREIPIEDTDSRQLQDAVLEEWQERAAQLHPGNASDQALDSAREVDMGQNIPQGTPTSRQHGRKPGEAPADIDQDRGSFEPGSQPPEGDGKKIAPEKDERRDRPSKGNKPNSPQPGGLDTDAGDKGVS